MLQTAAELAGQALDITAQVTQGLPWVGPLSTVVIEFAEVCQVSYEHAVSQQLTYLAVVSK